MRSFFGILLIVTGIFVIVNVVNSPSAAEAIGGIIGASVLTFVPAYFLLRKSKPKE